jgi:prepilin-type N-terminal cleavage/methylation domain-containing protein/prepilin-type processing-associated H-X9-DG protein
LVQTAGRAAILSTPLPTKPMQAKESERMSLARRRGFTLIELLVVIAIIGILAAMLFPVFARARESARKTQCLANVKNIAMGVQIYLTDYDAFPPGEHRQEAMDAFKTWTGEDNGCGGSSGRAYWGNPFLRPQVILDEYIKSREVWKCPSAKWDPSQWWIVPDYMGGYLNYLADTHGIWKVTNHAENGGEAEGGDPCVWAFPPGWGGRVTDSIGQRAGYATPAEDGAFACSIGIANESRDLKTSSIPDTSWYVVCADATVFGVRFSSTNQVIWELCAVGCGKDPAVYDSCPLAAQCSLSTDNYDKFWSDPTYRAKFTRHMGGSNLGFADGHAKWFTGEAIRNAVPQCIVDCNAGSCTKDDQGRPMTGVCP